MSFYGGFSADPILGLVTGCDNTIANPGAQPAPEDECHTVCAADFTEWCGGVARISVYQFSPPVASPPPSQSCVSSDVANFSLNAVYKDPPSSGPSSIPLKVVLVELVPNIVWTILSVGYSINRHRESSRIMFPHDYRHAHRVAPTGPRILSKILYFCLIQFPVPTRKWCRTLKSMADLRVLYQQTRIQRASKAIVRWSVCFLSSRIMD